MNSITSFIKRHPQATFWAIAWSTFFVGVTLGGLWYLLIYGSFLGGLLVTAIADGRNGVKTYLSRIVRWRVGIKWYAVALFTTPTLYLVAAALNVLSGAKLSTNIQWPPVGDVLVAAIWPAFLGISLAEEPGFRGFALPRLLVGRSALAAGLILGVLHTIWHFPTFLGGELIPILSTIVIIISGAIINTWLFNHTNGSVLLAMLLHTSIDIVSGDIGLLKPLFSGADASRQIIWLAVAYAGAAILLPLLTGKELGRKPQAGMDTMAAEQPVLAR
jgi:membrane protease YdiL (CAAX protease family)